MPTQQNVLYIESTMNPLVKCDDKLIKESIINPITNKPYKGIILEGIFACIGNLNNNQRVYEEENYLEFLKILKTQIHSTKGLYGEYEHPVGRYQIDSNNISHKILDVWYVPETKCVMGRVLILNRGKGLLAREIIESGGQLAISARAAGEEIDLPDGSKKAKITLLVTFDLVYHPGFANALLDVVTLNESLNMNFKETGKAIVNEPLRLILNESQLENDEKNYRDFINSVDDCPYIQWLIKKNLNEQQDLTKEQQQKLQNSQTGDDKKIEKNLEKSVDSDLEESEQEIKDYFFDNISRNQMNLKKQIISNKKHQGNSYFDNSAGFVNKEKSVSAQQ